ncbi:MAG: redoxin domain-containing protein [Frankiales bacterium]|nr:redoxin domain-containing protein [Frankiales bacterium]
MKYTDLADADCGIAQALGVVGDWWTLLVVRDVAGGVTRFDALQRELGVSRKTLTDRLAALVAAGVLRREAYSEHPPRYDYRLTAAGEGLLPVLIALQDWGDRYVLGDGSLTASGAPTSADARRAQALVGQEVPAVSLTGHDARATDPCPEGAWTVLYCFPGAFAPGSDGYPPGWSTIPGTTGCTLESRTYARRHAAFARRGVAVVGVSTQRPDQLAAFVASEELPFPLLSDADLRLTAALRLPSFRASGVERLKRLTLLVDPGRVVRHVQYPITDPAGSVAEMLDVATTLASA